MDEWIDRFADSLGEERLGAGEAAAVLRLARDVAHGAERKLAPLAAFVAGVHAGRGAGGAERRAALDRAVVEARGLLPAGDEPS
jgi:hypothetical protein